MSSPPPQPPPPPQLLQDFLLSPALGVEIVPYLRLSDLQRLSCTCKELNQRAKQKDWCRILDCLKEIEVLYCLDHDSNKKLLQKISQCIWRRKDNESSSPNYRVGVYAPSAGSLDPYNTIFEAFSGFDLVTTEGGTALSFASAHPFDLEHLGLEPDEHYIEEVAEEEKEDEEESSDENGGTSRFAEKRFRRTIECDSQFCQHRSVDRSTSATTAPRFTRVYCVNGSTYCGSCLDRDLYLRLLFCTEHNVGGDYRHNNCWSLRSVPYSDKEEEEEGAAEMLQLQPNEFWIHLWSTDPLNSCELRFIGVGNRNDRE